MEEIDQKDDLLYDLLGSTELKECPFCESDDIKTAIHTRYEEDRRPYHIYSIACRTCGVSNSNDDPEALINWWNRVSQ